MVENILNSGSDLVGITSRNSHMSFVFLADLIVFLLPRGE